MSVNIKELEKDSIYAVNGKELYKDGTGRWITSEELSTAELSAFRAHINSVEEK